MSTPALPDAGSLQRVYNATRAVESLGFVQGAAGGTVPRLRTLLSDFYVYQTSATTIKVTGGNAQNLVLLPTSESLPTIPVADSAQITPSNGDYIWLELVPNSGADNGTWTFIFNWTSSGTAPASLYIFYLAKITTTGGSISSIQRYWNGGDIVMQNMFVVSAVQTGGSAGGGGANCSFTYSLYNIRPGHLKNLTELASGLTPLKPRIPNVKYEVRPGIFTGDAPGSFCIASVTPDGNFQIVEVLGEQPLTRDQTVLTGISIDFNAKTFTTTTTTVRALHDTA